MRGDRESVVVSNAMDSPFVRKLSRRFEVRRLAHRPSTLQIHGESVKAKLRSISGKGKIRKSAHLDLLPSTPSPLDPWSPYSQLSNAGGHSNISIGWRGAKSSA